jgi:sugar lactone lactonase YvrE
MWTRNGRIRFLRRASSSCGLVAEVTRPGKLLSMKRFAMFAACLLVLSAPCLAVAQTTVIFLTSGTSWNVPNNWNNANNTIEVIGSGGEHTPGAVYGGNGGGSYSRISNLNLTPGNNVNYQIGISGQAVTTSGATWFNGTSISNASVSAEGGCSSTTQLTACSNSISSNVGTVKYAGGKGGTGASCGYVGYGGGGGGAAGPYGSGLNGQTASCANGNGGAGDNGSGGAGGAGSSSSAGAAGAEYTATGGGTAGSGGGGGGGVVTTGQGGAYGGGTGGSAVTSAVPGGSGLVVITYAPAPNIFTTNLNSSTVTAYQLGSSGNVTPLGSVTSATGLAQPDGIARDSSGKLYVANMAAASVTIYAPGASGNVSPIATITGAATGLTNPAGVAVDSAGNVYVADPGASAGYSDSIFVFLPGSNGNATPAATVSGLSTGLDNPLGIALDSSGNIYVANAGSMLGDVDSITVYPAGSSGNATPSASITGASTGLLIPSGIAVDSSRNIYVSNPGSQIGGSDSVTVYPAGSNGNATPSATISGTSTALDFPSGIAVDSSKNIYVTNDGGFAGYGDTITVYSAGSNGNVVPSETLPSLGLAAPAGIVVDSSGNLYVADAGSLEFAVDAVTVYPAGGLVPSETIGLDNALAAPTGVALDPSGNIYVANQGSVYDEADSINVYSPGTYANAPISAAIVGSNTGLAQPAAIAVNPNGSLYVANSVGGPDAAGSVTVYPSGSKGNATPSIAISGNSSGDNTGFSFPTGIAFDALGNLYVANAYGGPDGVGSITIYPPGSNGNVTPTATISDNPNCAPCDNTGLGFPYGVAVDFSGNIYVVNSYGGLDSMGSVTVYPPLGTSTGTLNESPSATIQGNSLNNDATGFIYPDGIALDSKANVYVTNPGSIIGDADSINVYSAGSNGNVAPSSTITGSSTGLGMPQGIAITWNAGYLGGSSPAYVKAPPKPKKARK